MITTLETRPRRRARAGVLGLLMRVDYTLIVTTLVVAGLGVVMVYTATRGGLLASGDDPHYYMKRQAAWAIVGIIAMVGVALFDYRKLESVAMALYGLMVLVLAAVLFVGSSSQGSERWFEVGGQQIQPSEFGVLAMILAVATYCSRRDEGLTWGDVVKVLVLAAIPILLVMKQPDLGTAIVMLVVLFVMLAVAGVPGRILLVLLIGAALVVLAALEAGILHHYQITRLTTFLHQDNQSVQRSAGYNLQQSKAAIGAGGFWGTGLLKGAATNLGYVPEQQTDFIFTAVGEQLGFIGASVTLFLLGLISFRMLRGAQVARDSFGRLLCAGLFAFVAFSVFQNAGMTMGIMPITGIPLPFMSYGGSAVLCFFLAVGLSLSVYARRNA